MGTSDDSRVGQLVTTTRPKRCVGIQTQMYSHPTRHDDLTTRDTTQPHNNSVGALIWFLPWRLVHTRGSGQDIHSTRVPGSPHECPSRWRGCGWPDTTTSFTMHHSALQHVVETCHRTVSSFPTGLGLGRKASNHPYISLLTYPV